MDGMATSHPSSMQMMNVFPVACSDLSVLKRVGVDRQRVDLIGKVVALKESELPKHLKFDLWLKDESDKEFLVQLWGETMMQQARTISHGDVDNAKTNNWQVALWVGGGTDGLADAFNYIHRSSRAVGLMPCYFQCMGWFFVSWK